ncbi:MFS transporter [Bacillus songklensis]|uniref:MFS transporter n=1 Tax=Bacillus songklensis TaxID=1069116 RepID=A0ABV8B8F1_9BACI
MIKEEVPALWTKSFLLLIIGNLFIFMSFQMLLPTMPPQAKAIGASDIEIGLVTTLFAVAAILVRPFIGFALESSSRKWLVIVGTVALFVLTICYSFTSIILLFLAVRFLHGFAWGWSTTVNGTAAVELVPAKRLGEGMGYFGLSGTIGMIIAPSLGILLYQNFGFEPLIIGSSILGLIAIIALACVKYHTPKAVQENTFKPKEFSFFGSLIDKDGWYPTVLTILTTFGYGAIVTFIVIFGEERGIDQIFLYYLCNAITATLIRPITGRWFDAKGPWTLVMVCAVLTIAGLWVLSYTYSVGMLILAGILFGAGYGSMVPALQAWTLSKTRPERRGIANGMFYSAIDLGIGLSAVVLGFISAYVELGTVFQMSSICFVIVIVMTWIDFLKEKKRGKGKQQTVAV